MRQSIDHCAGGRGHIKILGTSDCLRRVDDVDEAHVCRESWTATRHVIWHTDSGTLARVNTQRDRDNERVRELAMDISFAREPHEVAQPGKGCREQHLDKD